jgi:hypothetical protein
VIRRRASLALASLVAAVAALVGSCKAFDESLLDGAVEDAGVTACPDGTPLRRPPPRPTGDDGDDGETYFFALRGLLVNQEAEDRWATIGYDLDGICTTEAEPVVECYPPSPSAPPEFDGEGGTDNVLGHQVFALIVSGMEGIEEELQSYQTDGVGCLLVQIRGWNGQDDDPRVEAVVSQSIFGTPMRPERVDSYSISGNRLIINGEEYPRPAWEGADYWYADAANYLEGNPERPRTLDDNAYVANRTLVMRIPDRYPIAFRGDTRSAVFLLTNSYFTAKISADSGSIEEGTLAGRFGVNDLLSTVPLVGYCTGSREYAAFSQLLDLAADIRLVAGTGGPTATCDALSVGLYYQRGTRAELGGIVPTYPLMNPCVDGGIQPDGGPDGGPADGGFDGGAPADGGFDGGVPPADAGDTDAGIDGG